MNRFSAGWQTLNPRWRRLVTVGGIATGLLLVLSWVLWVDTPPPAHSRHETIKQLLTDKDTRELGLDGLVAEFRTLRTRIETLQRDFDQLQAGQPTSLADKLNRQSGDLEATRNELRELREELRRLGRSPPPEPVKPPQPPQFEPPKPETPKVEPPKPESRTPAVVTPAAPPVVPPSLFTPPAPSGVLPGQSLVSGLATLAPASRPAPKIRVLREEQPAPAGESSTVAGTGNARTAPAEARASGTARRAAAVTSAPTTHANDRDLTLYLPTSILSGTLLTGLDAPTGQNARSDPLPILLRIKHEALLPNRYTLDIRECFLTASGYGDLSSERAYLRAETLACVRQDGGVIETPLEAYAVGEDGKAGVGGRLVSKQGQLLARALQAGFLQAFAQMFQKQPVAVLSTRPGDQVSYQSNLSPDALGSATLAGVGSALDRLAQFYLSMAEGMFPVIEINAGRPIDFVVLRGRELKLRDNRNRG